MNIKSAIPIIKLAVENNINLMLKGPPGIGKTDAIKQVAEFLQCNFMISHPVISEPTDYKGLPALINNFAEFLPYGDLRKMIETEKLLIVLFDDVGQAANTVQAALMQICLERQISGKQISKHVRFLMATNNRKDSAGVAGLLTPLINRFTVLQIEAESRSWVEWALKNSIPLELIAFIRQHPDLIMTFKAEKDAAFASPRSITMLGKWINSKCFDYETWQGCVGETFAIPFKAFFDMYSALAGWPDKIIQNPKDSPIPDENWIKNTSTKMQTDIAKLGLKKDEADKRFAAIKNLGVPCLTFALCGALANRANDVTFNSIMEYAKRLPEEYGMSLYIDSTSRNPSLMESRASIEWQVSHQETI